MGGTLLKFTVATSALEPGGRLTLWAKRVVGQGLEDAAIIERAFLVRSVHADPRRKALGRAPPGLGRSGLQVGRSRRSGRAASRAGQIWGRLGASGAVSRTGPPGRRLFPEGFAGQVRLGGGVPWLPELF